jgi:hypothetical protein
VAVRVKACNNLMHQQFSFDLHISLSYTRIHTYDHSTENSFDSLSPVRSFSNCAEAREREREREK